MAATFLQEQAAIEGRFASGWTTTTVKYENLPFVYPETDPWVALTVRNGQGGRGDISQNNPLRFLPGVVTVQVFVRELTDSKLAIQYADTIAAIWRDVSVTVGATDHLRFYEPTIERLGVRDGWFQVNVTTPFRREGYG